jgi:DNA-binding NtrC family response regulator
MGAQVYKILIADDDQYIRDDLGQLLADHSRQLFFAGSASETWQIVQRENPHLVLLDIKFPDSDDLCNLKRIKEGYPNIEVIILTSQTENLSQVVAAIKMGAYDYVGKPFNRDELRNRIEKALKLHSLVRSNRIMQDELERRDGLERIIGSSAAMEHVRQTIRRLADSEGCVLVHGESGTGKELAAKALHYSSKRRSSPFITINCAAIPESLIESVFFGHRRGAFTGAIESTKGKFELAEDGTIFLDEIGDMPISQQPALLRVLEYRTFTPVGESRERECRARFVFATNRDLRDCIAQRTFREDLFYRINVAAILLPALRSHPNDIPDLVEHYRIRISNDMGRKPVGIHPEFLEVLKQYDWPGNARELKNVLEGALMFLEPGQQELTLQNLPPEILATRKEEGVAPPSSTAERREKQELIRALRQCKGNLTQAANVIGIHRNTIRHKMRFYGISHSTISERDSNDQ